MKTPLQPPSIRNQRGFTLLELIGVLSILVLLSCLVAESVLQRVRLASRTAEAATLRTLAEAFKSAASRQRQLPAATNVVTLLSQELALTPSQVSLNPQKLARAILYDPSLGFGASGTAPYIQGVRGAREVNNLRVLLVSSLTESLPDLSTSNHFASLWNASPNVLPADWPSTWTGEPGDLLIERLDLRPLFCRLHLNNLDQVLIGRYAIDATNTSATLAANATTNGWYWSGSQILLISSDGSLQVTEVLLEDSSYVYEDGRWGRYLVTGKTKPAGAFGALVDQFLSALPPPPNPNQFGANQQAIVDEMYYYMWSYAQWASDGFPKGGSSSSQHVPALRFIEDSSVRLKQVSNNILKK